MAVAALVCSTIRGWDARGAMPVATVTNTTSERTGCRIGHARLCATRSRGMPRICCEGLRCHQSEFMTSSRQISNLAQRALSSKP